MTNPALLRFSAFFLSLSFCLLVEFLLPRRKPAQPVPRRLRNLGLGALGVVAVKLLPFTVVGAAQAADLAGFGLLNAAPLAPGPRFVLSLILLDLLIYWQHRLFHGPAALWTLHSAHHSDADFDATTGVRFHPGELLLSAGIKSAGAALLGVDVLAAAVFEVILSSATLFSHSNIKLPGFLDKLLRLVLVTPDMHRVHHSVASDEMNSNFGFALPYWDRLFGTYRAQPRAPHASMALGLPS